MSDEHAQEQPDVGRRPHTPTLEFARRLAHELEGAATVEIDGIEGGISVTITPANPQARAFGWADFSDELVLEVGDYGGRWELEGEPDDVALLEDIARSSPRPIGTAAPSKSSMAQQPIAHKCGSGHCGGKSEQALRAVARHADRGRHRCAPLASTSTPARRA